MHTRFFGIYKVARLGRVVRIGPLVFAISRRGIRRRPGRDTV